MLVRTLGSNKRCVRWRNNTIKLLIIARPTRRELKANVQQLMHNPPFDIPQAARRQGHVEKRLRPAGNSANEAVLLTQARRQPNSSRSTCAEDIGDRQREPNHGRSISECTVPSEIAARGSPTIRRTRTSTAISQKSSAVPKYAPERGTAWLGSRATATRM